MIPGYPRAVMGRKKVIRLIGVQTGVSSPIPPILGQRAGDLMLMLLARSRDGNNMPLPAGYTNIENGSYSPGSIGTGVTIRAAYRFAESDEESPAFIAIGDHRATLLAYRNASVIGASAMPAGNDTTGKVWGSLSTGITDEVLRVGVNVYKTVPTNFGAAIPGFELLNTVSTGGIHEVYHSLPSDDWGQVNFNRSAVAWRGINFGVY